MTTVWTLIFSLLLLFSSLSFLLAVSQSTSPQQKNNNDLIISELHEMKLKIARLEDKLEESTQKLKAKCLFLQDLETQNEEMSNRILDLHSVLSDIKGVSSPTDDRLNALEKEVESLWSISRKNNFDLHVLESKAQDAEDRLDLVKSHVQKMADIVTEQWIQIRHLEEALHNVEMKALEAQKQLCLRTCTFFQRIVLLLDQYLHGELSTLSSYGCQVLHQFKRILSTAKKYHIEFQGFIKQQMVKNDFTATLANEELIFFVASAVITFPVMMLLSLLC